MATIVKKKFESIEVTINCDCGGKLDIITSEVVKKDTYNYICDRCSDEYVSHIKFPYIEKRYI